jgi:hypothetical protein
MKKKKKNWPYIALLYEKSGRSAYSATRGFLA